jgi:hypothetical protein
MKKISLVVLMLLAFATVSNASVNGYIDGRPIVKVMSNGQVLEPTGTPAMVYNDYTMVPISILRQLGFTVTWSQETYTVTITPPAPIVIEKIVEVLVNPEGEPIPESNTPPLDAEGVTIPPSNGEGTGGGGNPTVPTEPTPDPTPEPEPTPDNSAACQQIRDSATIEIFNIENSTGMGADWKIEQVQNSRDSSLSSAGC